MALPANIYVFKVTNRNTRKRFEIFSKLTMKTLLYAVSKIFEKLVIFRRFARLSFASRNKIFFFFFLNFIAWSHVFFHSFSSFALWSFFLFKLYFISINLSSDLTWNTVMHGLVLCKSIDWFLYEGNTGI